MLGFRGLGNCTGEGETDWKIAGVPRPDGRGRAADIKPSKKGYELAAFILLGKVLKNGSGGY